MKILPDWVKNGYLRVIDPVAAWLIRRRVNPNTLSTLGLLCSVCAGAVFASGHISLAGWVLGLTAIFDVLDGVVARGSNRSTTFGAFYDSTLDRIADGAVLGGIAIFWASSDPHRSIPMVALTLLALLGAFLVSYTRARAEALDVDAKVGLMQRPERVVLLAAPQAVFGLALGGVVLKAILVFLAVTAWITVYQRVVAVRRATALSSEPTKPRRVDETVPRTSFDDHAPALYIAKGD